VLNIEIVKLCS